MTVNVIEFKEMGGGSHVGFCSTNRNLLIQYMNDHKLPGELNTRNFNFDINDVEQVYSINCDLNHMDVFIDCGLYLKTYDEAIIEEKKLNDPKMPKKYLVEHISVVK